MRGSLLELGVALIGATLLIAALPRCSGSALRRSEPTHARAVADAAAVTLGRLPARSPPARAPVNDNRVCVGGV
jgi:hypothetical protein